MRKGRLVALIAILTSFLLVFAACEPVSGVNLNNVLKSPLEQQSFEGNMSLKVELDEEGANPLSAGGPLGFFTGLELDLYEVKQQDMNTISLKGDVIVMGQKIPVAMSATTEEMVIELEGIERPLVTRVNYEDLGLDAEDFKLLNVELTTALYNYFIPNLPNPKSITVERAAIDVNGTEENVRKIHAEIAGDEFKQLLEELLNQLAEDEEGLREFLDVLYDALIPFINDAIDSMTDLNGDETAAAFIRAYLNNKTLVTEFLYTTITQGYQAAVRAINGADDEWLSGEEASFLENTAITVDLYIDNNQNIIRTDYAVRTGGLSITASMQKWNVNETVEADILSGENGIDLDSFYLEEEVLSAVDGSSVIGQLLTALGANQKTTFIWLDDEDVHYDNGTTFLSAYSIGYELGVELDWTKLNFEDEVVYTDGTTTVVLPIDQNVIIINGESFDIPKGAFEDEYYQIFVPVRTIAEAFGYEVSWDPDYNTIDLVKTYF